MEETDPLKKKYKSLDLTVSNQGSFSYNEAKFVIVPVNVDTDGRYRLAHIGKKGDDDESYATHLFIYNLKNKHITSKSIKSSDLIESEQAAKNLCKDIAKDYTNVVLITDKILEDIKEGEGLENVIINITAEEDSDAEEVIKAYRKVPKEEKKYDKGEKIEEDAEAKKEMVEGEEAEATPEEGEAEGGDGDGGE